jgi:predicted DNA-binding protein (MmcQ/YjbR family)
MMFTRRRKDRIFGGYWVQHSVPRRSLLRQEANNSKELQQVPRTDQIHQAPFFPKSTWTSRVLRVTLRQDKLQRWLWNQPSLLKEATTANPSRRNKKWLSCLEEALPNWTAWKGHSPSCWVPAGCAVYCHTWWSGSGDTTAFESFLLL